MQPLHCWQILCTFSAIRLLRFVREHRPRQSIQNDLNSDLKSAPRNNANWSHRIECHLAEACLDEGPIGWDARLSQFAELGLSDLTPIAGAVQCRTASLP